MMIELQQICIKERPPYYVQTYLQFGATDDDTTLSSIKPY